jgi:hypothetical protein
MKTIAYVQDSNTGELRVYLSAGKMLNVLPSNEGYPKVKEILNQIVEGDICDDSVIAQAEAEIEEVISKKKQIEGATLKNGDKLEVRDNTVYFIRASDGEEYELEDGLADRLLEILKKKESATIMLRFLANMYQNPSRRAIRELFGFLRANDLPFTPDGHFLAYKKVRYDFFDIHSGTFDNSVGATPNMARNKVDDNPDSTCSRGLHICSKEYLPHYGCSDSKVNRVIVCKVNPADVVSIPRDYNNAKMRCCRYEVVDELPTFETTLASFVYGKHRKNFIKETFDSLIGFYKDFYKLNAEEMAKNDITSSIAGLRKSDETPAVCEAFVNTFAATFKIDADKVRNRLGKVMYDPLAALTLLSENDEDFILGESAE